MFGWANFSKIMEKEHKSLNDMKKKLIEVMRHQLNMPALTHGLNYDPNTMFQMMDIPTERENLLKAALYHLHAILESDMFEEIVNKEIYWNYPNQMALEIPLKRMIPQGRGPYIPLHINE